MEKVSKILYTCLLLLVFCLVTASCVALKTKDIDPWLTTISGAKAPEVNITGKWQDAAGTGIMTWGQGYLHQEQNKVRGVIGDYHIQGIVSGKMVYLVFLMGNKVSYTARLENIKDLLIGHYYRASNKEQKGGWETSFVRTGQ